jgi:hypothetical protein
MKGSREFNRSIDIKKNGKATYVGRIKRKEFFIHWNSGCVFYSYVGYMTHKDEGWVKCNA